jgi:hypothetical protein
MTKYLAGVLSVIAGGVLLVAWGLLSPGASALTYPNQNPYGVQAAYAYGPQPSFAGSTVPCANGMQVTYPSGNPYLSNGAMATPVSAFQPVQAVETVPVVRRRVAATRTDVRAPRRDWKRTALVVGGSTATAAGIGGLIGGKKGALVGAALGGGVSTLYETTRNR